MILVGVIFAIISFWPDAQNAPEEVIRKQNTQHGRVESGIEPFKAEARIVVHLIGIGSAELSFHGLKKRWGTIDELVHEHLLSGMFSDGAIIQNYQYSLEVGTDHFACFADPVPGPGRHYFVDDTLDLRFDDNGRASPSSPFLGYGKNEPIQSPAN